MACYNIMAVVVNHRLENALEVQRVLTKYGCIIRMRLGMHEAGDVCSQEGLIIMQLSGTNEEIMNFESELNSIQGVKANHIEICS